MSGDFWSRRKAAVEAEQAAEARLAEERAEAERDAALEDKSDAEILADLDLPDPDDLGQGDDFTVFLSKTVPQRIRTRALRRLWLTNPVLANVDGLVDYGEDFTDASCVIENLQTAYQVGKGMTEHVLEMARQAALEEEGEVDPETPEPDEPEAVEEVPEAVLAERQPAPTPVPAMAEVHEDLSEQTPQPIPRRMRFSFQEDATA
ncbi:DUF3306 domain-containing protein [Shimia sp. CNT1-13L.2]|uniref:DUF3306 domain-containing protein n=1 Tax=Shimia sp. CNT1-13L.2 TaxID=2959663 RepID=UPI0020CC501F|nr:DUF3306 domain-containing protein [Shimia sp. CNT1-13L.2]MCP9481770.1 DUF3306 domain-containing protein [Shimia sp. CNT1-13L.2]